MTRMNAADYRATTTEAELLDAVIDLARLRGWLVHHCRPARTSNGWRTPIRGDAGAPDLVLARAGVVVLAELKSERGRQTEAQKRWQQASGGHLWRPSDWPRIVSILTAPQAPNRGYHASENDSGGTP